MASDNNPTRRYAPIRPEWLATRIEPIIEPERAIVDSHHHLWDHPGNRYLLPEYLADIGDGHNVRATVYAECGVMHRLDGPVAMKPVGEVEFATSAGKRAAESDPTKSICAAIIGGADLRLGGAIEEVLEEMRLASEGRLRGIRNTAAWHSDPDVRPASNPPEGLLRDPKVREAVSRLPSFGLSFDAWAYHTQMSEVLDIARSFPDLTIVIDHIGGALAIGPYRGKRAEVFSVWSEAIAELAREPNVYLKFGGLGMRVAGFDFHELDRPPSSEFLAESWRPYFETCLESFGASRCMFESNFPVDKGMFSYAVLWNAFKRLAAGYSEAEKDALFLGSAASVYRLSETEVLRRA
ncbi:amidohydrolase family protein [Sinorhizobium meliloti]|uniref:amidohydrolase family protein n=1 Tax=Rhizobium meliloti TaxID=382 RepID=UPI001296EE37|nr:amidohydrolase family protein [Sinorhizobium meliloti]MDW9610875.1 amidohydrolase family protein [Sinorhizobium meliloti]MDW9835933.1 amidohydrolase family protein [Sinorhizobium meliloti]MDX0040378.1 amidohydrolase family protein [Sinorhizobium meliloti]MDX0088900.1 amidohydrolase family protein [Sinorhizobium meliloti]MQX63440.1 amidohydrolase family protein [Sinorhizobium meliloti]